jgi:hypothetical protein
MSSQSLNGTTYSDYTTNTFTGVTGFALRDASDFTKMLKEQAVKKEVVLGHAPKPYWIPYGNQYRLSYGFGRVYCADCTGGSPFT